MDIWLSEDIFPILLGCAKFKSEYSPLDMRRQFAHLTSLQGRGFLNLSRSLPLPLSLPLSLRVCEEDRCVNLCISTVTCGCIAL